jgi:tetratricopeptide (TPR) repeat protein
MEKLAREHPGDLEVQAFHALALLGEVPPDDPSVGLRMRAGAIALDVLAKNPDHPGAAHYVIHAFDDAEHAPIALPAARRYAQIAPEAFHARHMPAHIFVNLGMWEDAMAACESAWAASEAWVARRHHAIAKKDYHSLDWLVHIYHQQGRLAKSEEALARMGDAVAKSRDLEVATFYARAVSAFVQRTGQTERLEKLLAPVVALQKAGAGKAGAAGAKAGGAAAGCHNPGGYQTQVRLAFLLARIRALAAAMRGDEAEMRKQLALEEETGKQLADSTIGRNADLRRRMDLVAAEGLVAAAQKRYDEAEARLRTVIEMEQKSSFHAADPAGLATETKLGQVLLAAHKPKEAAAAFAAALRVTPGDSLALLGAARAARDLGDATSAAEQYRALASQWSHADASFPDATEVRENAR